MTATRLCTKWKCTVNGITADGNDMAALCCIMAVWLKRSKPYIESMAALTCSMLVHVTLYDSRLYYSQSNRSCNISSAESIIGLIWLIVIFSTCHILLSWRNVFTCGQRWHPSFLELDRSDWSWHLLVFWLNRKPINATALVGAARMWLKWPTIRKYVLIPALSHFLFFFSFDHFGLSTQSQWRKDIWHVAKIPG